MFRRGRVSCPSIRQIRRPCYNGGLILREKTSAVIRRANIADRR